LEREDSFVTKGDKLIDCETAVTRLCPAKIDQVKRCFCQVFERFFHHFPLNDQALGRSLKIIMNNQVTMMLLNGDISTYSMMKYLKIFFRKCVTPFANIFDVIVLTSCDLRMLMLDSLTISITL
jgi:hypothetical protein